MSGGYGPGGYPGQGYGAPDYDGDPNYDGDPDRGRPRRQGGGQQPRDASVWQNDQDHAAYDAPPGYGAQEFGGPGYGDQGYDPRTYGQPDGPGYPQQGPGTGGHRYQGTGPQPGQYGEGPQPVQRGTSGPPQFDQYGRGPRHPASGHGQRDNDYEQRGGNAYGQPGDNAYGQGGYDDWEQDQSDRSFLPGFGGREEFDDGPAGDYAPERGSRYDDYDNRRAPRRGRPDGRGPVGGSGDPGGAGPGRSGRGPDPRGSGDIPRDRDDWGDSDPRPRRKATRWLPRILVLTVVAVIVIGGLVGGLDVYHKYEARYHPADYAGQGTGDVTVQVMSGDTAFSLAPRLVQLGVIASTRAFSNAAEAVPTTTTGLEAGFYVLHHHMQASLAYADLLNPKNRVQTTVTIPEGKRAVDVIAILSQKTKIPLKDFQQILAQPAQLGLPSYANGKVEGYLFPATYAIVPHETALQILQAMVQRFDVEAQQVNLVAEAKTAGLTPTQLIIEASLNQAEGGSVSDYPKIAEVIHNRLAKGMHLQFDSTVLYGLGKYAVSATFKQINTPGPYNTYLNAGLPAGPISNPGDAAIQGVLHPDQGNWLYFLTVPGGKSQFSATPLKGQ